MCISYSVWSRQYKLSLRPDECNLSQWFLKFMRHSRKSFRILIRMQVTATTNHGQHLMSYGDISTFLGFRYVVRHFQQIVPTKKHCVIELARILNAKPAMTKTMAEISWNSIKRFSSKPIKWDITSKVVNCASSNYTPHQWKEIPLRRWNITKRWFLYNKKWDYALEQQYSIS